MNLKTYEPIIYFGGFFLLVAFIAASWCIYRQVKTAVEYRQPAARSLRWWTVVGVFVASAIAAGAAIITLRAIYAGPAQPTDTMTDSQALRALTDLYAYWIAALGLLTFAVLTAAGSTLSVFVLGRRKVIDWLWREAN